MAITVEFVSRTQQHSQFDWADILCGSDHIGKARCDRHDREITGKAVLIIYSINIYPEWAGHGYGREVVDYCKHNFEIIVADRVRHSAIGFWETMGFRDTKDGNWVYYQNYERDKAWIYCRNEGA